MTETLTTETPTEKIIDPTLAEALALEAEEIAAEPLAPKRDGRADYWRQLDLFNPDEFTEEVHVIGVGATGGELVDTLAKMGVKNIHAHDFDIVEEHNLPNQPYRLKDVGRPKVEALREIILEKTGTEITIHNEATTGATKLKGIVYLMVDRMDVRKEIWNGAIKYKLAVKFMVETRMGIDNGRVYAIIPSNPDDIKFWENSLCTDKEADASPCTNLAIMPTVRYIANVAAWKLIKFFNLEKYQRELILCARPMIIIGDEINLS